MKMSIFALSILVAAFVSGPVSGATKIRAGHFPNITHAQGVIAHALSRQGKGWFEQRLGPDTKIEWFVYNAGPSAMEAIFAKSIDLTYVGSGTGAQCLHEIERPGDSFDCRCGERRIRTGCATGLELKGGGGFSRKVNAIDQVIGIMLVIVVIGLLADKILFSPWERFLHRRWGTGRV